MTPNAAYANQTASEVRVTEVTGEMERLRSECETLDKQINALESRLSSVLSARSEQGDATKSAPEPIRVPLAQDIHDRATHLSLLSGQISSLLNRIEL